MENEFINELKVEIKNNDVYEEMKMKQEIKEQNKNQIETIYRLKTKKLLETNKSELFSLIAKELNNGDINSTEIYISKLELAILNDIAVMYQYQTGDYGEILSSNTKRYIDINIYNIVKNIENMAYKEMELCKKNMPQYYDIKLKEYGKKDLVLAFRPTNTYKEIMQMRKKESMIKDK